MPTNLTSRIKGVATETYREAMGLDGFAKLKLERKSKVIHSIAVEASLYRLHYTYSIRRA